MDYFKPHQDIESTAAPAPLSQSKKYSDCTYLCFNHNSNFYNEEGFILKSKYPILSLKKYKTKNLIVLCVYCEGILNKAVKWFTSKFYFKIAYEFPNSIINTYPSDFTVEKDKIKFIFDAGNESSAKGNLFINPSCLEQYKAFQFVSKEHEKLFEEAKNYLAWNLDMELFLFLLNERKDKREELVNLFLNFPNFQIKYDINKSFPQIDFGWITPNKAYKDLILVYSIIQDSKELVKDFEENNLLDFIEYNEIHKDKPLIIKKNIFEFFISKFNKDDSIKKTCLNVYSIPLLFEYLSNLNSEQFKKVKKLTINDIPNIYSDDLIGLIEKYEKIKDGFEINEIEKIIKRFLNVWYEKKNIKQLEQIIDKMISIKEEQYINIINEIKSEIVKKGKLLIKQNILTGFAMYKFINKYKDIGNFYSEEKLLGHLGENIVLEELDKDENILNEFNKCDFINAINSQLISNFISGILSKINGYQKFDLLFKHVYIIKEKQNDEKNVICINLILTYFNSLSTRIRRFPMTDEFKYILQKIIILSVMYINDKDNNNNFKEIIKNLSSNGSFNEDYLFNIFIEVIINTNLEIYFSKEEKEKVCEYIIKKYYFNLNIEKKIDFLLKIKSTELREKLIFNNHKYFPIIQFSDLLEKEDNIFFLNMKYFIEKRLLANEDFLNGEYFQKIISECNIISERLEQKEINFFELNKLKELINKNKIEKRIFLICLGDSQKSKELIEKVKTYTEKYINYSKQLNTLITYNCKYYPNSKKEEINKYNQQLANFQEIKINICSIELNEQIHEEIKIFEKYEHSKFFSAFYNNINNEKDEIIKFNKAIEIFNECEKLFNGQNFELEFLEVPLDKLEDINSNENLLKEIAYLKENFKYKDTDEKQITDYLMFYKRRKKISNALKSFVNIYNKVSDNNSINIEIDIEKLANNIGEIKNYLEIKDLVELLNKFDKNFLDKNFIAILLNFYQNDQLIIFLNNQKESQTRDLIDGLFDDDNEESCTVELQDIEILINVVCFFQELKLKTQNINDFLNNFHSILNEKNYLYKDIVSNIVHIKENLNLLQDFVKIQLGKKYKYSTNIKNFIENGIIKFVKMKKEKTLESFFLELFRGNDLDKINLKEDIYFNAIIKIDNKEENFEMFIGTIKKIKAKNAYKYGKNKEYLLKTTKIAQLIDGILTELNYDVQQEFNEEFKVADFQFEDKGILKLPQLEKILDNLRKKNNEVRMKKLHDINTNVFSQFVLGLDMVKSMIDAIDLEEIEKKEKIESYFPNIQMIEESDGNKVTHKHIVCDGCAMYPIVGIRYKCKVCKNFDYCESCYNKNKEAHSHEFEKIEKPVKSEQISDKILDLLTQTKIKSEYNFLKGLYFYNSTKDFYEIDILKLYNELIGTLPYYFNLLLCYDNLEDEQIYAFCVRAVNCATNNLYILVRPEEFKIAQERLIMQTLNKLLEKKGYKMESCLIILYINQNSHIIKQLNNLKKRCKFPSDPPLFKKIENLPIESLKNLQDLPVEIVTSDSPRVGKSYYIQSKIKDSARAYFTLGDINGFYLMTMTSQLNDYIDKDICIIFELYENPDENTYNLIKNFLFKFILLKNYGDFNYINKKNIQIFIEVSSDYTNFDEDFKFLKLFKRHFIRFKNCPDFYERNKINMAQKGKISNVLKALKTFKPDLSNEALIKEFFIKKYPSEKNSNNLPNFGQLEMFYDLFGDLYNNFNKFKEISPEAIKAKQKKFPFLKTIRDQIISSYLEFVIKFSTFSYESILENQIEAAKYQKELAYKLSEKKKNYLLEKMNKKRIITFNDIKHGIILYNDIPSSIGYDNIFKCTILKTYEKDKEDEEYKILNKFYSEYLGFPALTNLLDMGASEYRTELKNICLTNDDLTEFTNQKLDLMGYVFTLDNFIKMVLIYLRIRAKVPLILLGETGCGKTSLIESLSYFIADRYRLVKFNIYSGLDFFDINDFLKKNNLYASSSKEYNMDTILFLDEINTTNCLNLLCDLFVEHSFLGKRLKPNVFIIAACNPYRLMLSNTEEIGYINKKMHRVRNLVYTVNPLPLCLINYIFDFGNVKEEDEREYIEKFLNTFLNENFSKKNHYNYKKIIEIINEAVHSSQKYIRENSEISAVSLREIKRFKIFFEFFFKITKEREEFKNPDYKCIKDNSIFSEVKTPEDKKEDLIVLKATNLGLFMCFYLRIMDYEKRKKLAENIEKILKFDFLEYPHKLQNELADSLKLDQGIAKNRALLDNLFTLFVCLNNNIPIFICGKAGCSKSLSFSLLFQAMKGEYSESKLFKKYPSLYVTSYQGSLTSSSEEIKTIFNRAKKVNAKQKNNEKKNLSVILFDELGLAEISPNNPLKVIHSELDDKREVGFVGISNWTLDASKMNRGIHLSIQEPDENDLTLTATTIAKNIFEEIDKIDNYKKLIKNLTKSYFEYKNFIKNKSISNYDFHGLRDFYSLIKITARALKNNVKNISLEKIAMESIERNFGGLELNLEGNTLHPSTKEFKEIFSKCQNNFVEDVYKYDIFSCIKNNLENDNNRYLLLITNKTKNETLIEFILKKLKKDYRFIQGSKLKEDQNEDYVLEKTWSIISFMENGEIIILKDLEIIYPKFYDLFNQNFQKFGDSNYARIVLDSTTNERRIVNKNFRCIVLLEQRNVDEQDPPFLNRFEKHLMSFRYLLTEQQNNLAKKLFNEIKELAVIPENKNDHPLLVNINIEEIRCLILNIASIYEDDIENHIYEIYKVLIPTFTQENILNAVFSPQKKYIKKDDLIQIYEENTHTNIFKFLKNVKKNKIMIYTFSPYYKDIFTEDNSKDELINEKFGIICKSNTVEITFNKKVSEKMLNYFFQLYYEKENYNLFIMHFNLKDSKYLKYIKYQLDEFHKINKVIEKKIYLFIIHIEKNYIPVDDDEENSNDKTTKYLEKYHSYFFSFLSEYQQITIDNLLEQRDISVLDLFNKTNEELITIPELLDINLNIKKEFSRQIKAHIQEGNSLIDKIDNLHENGVINCIIKKIQNIVKNSDNILRRILVKYSSPGEKDYDFISFFLESMEELISNNSKKIIIELIKNGYIVSYFFEKEIPSQFKKVIFSFINNVSISKSASSNLEEYIYNLKIPGSQILFKNLKNLVKICKIEYLNVEEEYRKPAKKKTEKSEKKKLENVHYKKKQFLKNRLWNEELLTEEIFSQYYQEILKDFFTFYFYDQNTKTSITQRQEEFLFFIFSKRNENDTILDRFLYFCLWVGSYHEIIAKMLEIFNKLDKYFKPQKSLADSTDLSHDNQNLLDSIKENYDLFNVSDEKEKENESKKVNGIFYCISESFCHVMTNINNINIDSIDLKSFCTEINEVAQILTQFNSTLNLELKGQYTFLSIVKFIEISQKKNIEEKEFKKLLSVFIKNIFDEKFFMLKNDIHQAKQALIEQIKITNNLSSELSSKIFVNKLLQYTKFEKYKLELVKTLFQFPQLIKFSSLFFNYIFLTQPIKPKRQNKRHLNEDEKKEFLDKFGEIKNSDKKAILKEINDQAENNEILKEILLYIFELRIISYFDGCQNSKLMEGDEYRKLILTGLNFDYFVKASNDINNNNFGKLHNLGMIFDFAFIRCYLYYFVKLQLEFNNFGDLTLIHHHIFDISNSDFGKLIILYIAKHFILKNKKEYFLKSYLKDETANNWKNSILPNNPEDEMFPVERYENFKHLLFYIWSNINNDNLKNIAKYIGVQDIYYIIDFIYNEISMKIKSKVFEKSTLLEKINEVKEGFQFDRNVKRKINILFEKISDFNFLKEENIKSNLKLIFIMIKFYILGFIGYKNNSLFSLIFSDNIIHLIKIFYNNNIKDEWIFIQSYYEMKKYLEEEYLSKDNYYPVYICSCGKWYTIKDSLPTEIKNCKCGLKIGGINEVLVERKNHCAIYYDENQKKYIEERKAGNNNGKCKLKGILLQEFKEEFIINKIINKSKPLGEFILDGSAIDEQTFPGIFLKFVFLSQIFIDYIIGLITKDELIQEFNSDNILDNLINLNKNIEDYLNTKNIHYNHFINCEILFNLIKTTDCIKEKDKIYKYISILMKQLEQRYKKDPEAQEFNNLEMNTLTLLTYDNNFKNENYKYLLTVSQYPNIDLLKEAIPSYTKKSLPILESFIKLETKKYNIEHLSHLETINDFINSFSEKTRNIITRKSAKNDTIGDYLIEIKKGETLDDNNLSFIDKQFEDFSIAYEDINRECITRDSEVIKILNDNKIKGEETAINKLYSHLIEIQNYFLNKIIEEYNNRKKKDKEDIIIKNAIEQIQKEKYIQLCTKADIFSFNVSNKIILSFEELYSFYSLKNIFNENNNIIDYSRYSEVKFKLNMIEKELVNIILTGKKLFSEKQITYKFYLDPYEEEEKTKKFGQFTELYGKEKLTEEEKGYLSNLSKLTPNLKRIILPNLEILIFYLVQENKLQGNNKIGQINLHSNLYLDNKFFQLFNDFYKFSINKLISMYEYLEEVLFDFIKERYIIPEFQKKIPFEYEAKLNKFYDEESKRELKNDLLTSLLIKFVCRYLPNETKESQSRDLFEMIREKNIYLPEQIREELKYLKDKLGAKLSYAIEITKYFKMKRFLGQLAKEKNNVKIKEKNEIKIEENVPKKKEPEEVFEDDPDDDRDV